jgi:hypothetical protein
MRLMRIALLGVLSLLGLSACAVVVDPPSVSVGYGRSTVYAYDQDEVVLIGGERYYYRYYPSYGGWVYVRPSCWGCARPVWYLPSGVVVYNGPWVYQYPAYGARVRYMYHNGHFHADPPRTYVPRYHHRHIGDAGPRWDRDGDGVPNWRDSRPNNPYVDQRTRRDHDGDGVPNWRDSQPHNPRVGERTRWDSDGDGIPNRRDPRPYDPRPRGSVYAHQGNPGWQDRNHDGRPDRGAYTRGGGGMHQQQHRQPTPQHTQHRQTPPQQHHSPPPICLKRASPAGHSVGLFLYLKIDMLYCHDTTNFYCIVWSKKQ